MRAGELRGRAIGYAHFPDLLAAPRGFPDELAEINRLAGFDGDVGAGEFTEDAVGERTQGVLAGANLRNAEPAVLVSDDPELVVLGVGLPIDLARASWSRC